MKRILTLLYIVLITFSLKAQDHSLLSIGAGYPFFMGTKSDDPHYDYFINNRNYNLFLEKTISPFKKVPEFLVTPGLAYTRINESYTYETLGGGGKGKYEHQAFSGYVKLLFEIDRQPDIVTDYYFGVQIGYYFHSETTGSKSNWMMNPEGVKFSNSETIDNNGEDFFHTHYYGIVAGMQPLGDRESFLKPRIELAFYPSFARVNSYYYHGESTKSMFQISVSFGIG